MMSSSCDTSSSAKLASDTLLVIGYVWPEPCSSAAGSRMLQLIRAFQQAGYQVVYASPAEYSDHAADLAALHIRTQRIAVNDPAFDHFLQALNPAVVMFDRFMMEEQFGWRVENCCPAAVRILDTEDLHSLRHARHAMLKAGATSGALFPPAQFAHSELAVREIAAILRCDLSLIISEAEMQWLQQQFQVPASQLLYLPFMETEQPRSEWPDFSQRRHFISIGNFRHEPNWDAVRYLKEDIWPQIRQQLPSAELHIYGAYPPKKATQLHNDKQGFLVKGWAPDALTVISAARVLLAPLRFGAGLKGKLLDAANAGTPAVTTPLGAEGMYLSEEPCARVADSAEALAANAVSLYQDEREWQKLSDRGRRLIAARFDFSIHAPRLCAALKQVMADVTAHRQQHFYGMMLRHHSLKSTQYMAQWIEAKNRLKQENPS
tara:strand:+ start:22267 stop:23568 length:1302 start_codon:yes stop_codon:yes gene_type:complete